ARGPGQPRDAAIEHVEDDGDADERRGGGVFAACREDDARVAAEQVGEREKARQQVHASPEAPRLRVAPPEDLQHRHRRQLQRAITLSPPRTRSPVRTSRRQSRGTKTSMRDPNFITPYRSPV